MKLQLFNHTLLVAGGHPTTSWINVYVNARLGDFGPAVEAVWIQLLYPEKDPAAKGAPGFAELVARAPRVTFYRAKRKIKIDVLCPKVPPRSILAAGHLSLKEVGHVLDSILSALQLIRPKIRATDDFELPAFLAAMQAILADCRVDIVEELESF